MNKIRGMVVLDPFSVVCRLALLPFKPEGTKLVIRNNHLEFAHPHAKELAWRWFMSHFFDHEAFSRAALCNLRRPICRALRWYHDRAPTVFEHAENGLKRLFELYRKDGNDNAVEVLRSCLNIVQHFDELPQLADDEEDAPREQMLSKLQSMWGVSEVQGFESLMLLLSTNSNDMAKQAAICSIESYLTEKEPQLGTILNQSAV
jgi:hypothetical protein